MRNINELILLFGMVDLISLSRQTMVPLQSRYAYLRCYTVIATGLYGIHQGTEKRNGTFSDLFAHIVFCIFCYTMFQLRFNKPHLHRSAAAIYVSTSASTQPNGMQPSQPMPLPAGQQLHYA